MGIITLIYLLFIAYLFVRVLLHSPNSSSSKSTRSVDGLSIVIPFRNEESNLNDLLVSLAQQNCDVPYETILINDNSDDNYERVINSIQKKFPDLNLSVIDSSFDSSLRLTSKQQAIDTGVKAANYSVLVFTDADMIFNGNWLNALLNKYDEDKHPFIFGRTSIIPKKTVLSFLQEIQLDFLFSSAWLLNITGFDSSCMGNNIAVSKKLYDSIGGQKGIGYTIVEDKKLLSAVKKQGISPVSTNDFSAFAMTKPVDSFKTFLHQMLRWLKGGGGESVQIFAIMAIFLLELISLVVSFFIVQPLYVTVLLYSGLLLTWLLFVVVFGKIGLKNRIIQFPLIIVTLILESFIVIPSALFISPNWKGRKLKTK